MRRRFRAPPGGDLVEPRRRRPRRPARVAAAARPPCAPSLPVGQPAPAWGGRPTPVGWPRHQVDGRSSTRRLRGWRPRPRRQGQPASRSFPAGWRRVRRLGHLAGRADPSQPTGRRGAPGGTAEVPRPEAAARADGPRWRRRHRKVDEAALALDPAVVGRAPPARGSQLAARTAAGRSAVRAAVRAVDGPPRRVAAPVWHPQAPGGAVARSGGSRSLLPVPRQGRPLRRAGRGARRLSPSRRPPEAALGPGRAPPRGRCGGAPVVGPAHPRPTSCHRGGAGVGSPPGCGRSSGRALRAVRVAAPAGQPAGPPHRTPIAPGGDAGGGGGGATGEVGPSIRLAPTTRRPA